MGSLDDKPLYDRPMKIYDKEQEDAKGNTFGAFIASIPEEFEGYVFLKLYRDPQGNSGSNPTWGNYYKYSEGEMSKCGNGVYKSHDYDFPEAPYCEKLWSILGKRIFHNPKNKSGANIRVPHITIVSNESISDKYARRGVISHIIMDNDKEDLIGMNLVMFNKFERQQLEKMRSVVVFDDLLDCIKKEIGNQENFEEVEKQIVQVLLLDAVTNNVDRHTKNWALVRDKETNRFTLGVFDHGSSFVDLVSDRPMATIDNCGVRSNWTSTYMKIEHVTQTLGLGDSGEKIVRYLVERYPEVTQEFFESLCEALPEFGKEIEDAPDVVKSKKVMSNLAYKKRFIEKLLERQRGEGYDYDD